ncbi:MAG: hypothetical protein CMM46_17930 [Rhodospirillaceae bacterium]|nr:hypothetical protein [Rhodospirillaceae bacterium]
MLVDIACYIAPVAKPTRIGSVVAGTEIRRLGVHVDHRHGVVEGDDEIVLTDPSTVRVFTLIAASVAGDITHETPGALGIGGTEPFDQQGVIERLEMLGVLGKQSQMTVKPRNRPSVSAGTWS